METKKYISKTTSLLGNKFVLIKGLTPLRNKNSELYGYEGNISIVDENSPFFYELIQVRIMTTTPTLSYRELQQNKKCPVTLSDLRTGIWNDTITFTSSDIKSVSEKE